MANSTRIQLDALSQSNFPDNTTQLISPADLRQWLEDGVDSFVTQKDKSTLENAIYEAKGSLITAAATTDLSLATGNLVHIADSGSSVAITYFGNCPAGARFVLVFDNAVTITASASIIIPGIPSGNNKVTLANDCCMIVSEGSGNWRIVGYFPAAGAGSGTLTQITASAPLTGGTITTSGTIGIPKADASNDGYLDNADWSTFNGKQDALGFTPVPDYRNINVNSPLLGGGNLTADLTLSIPQADATNNGYLSSSDWAGFDSKQDAITLTTTGTSGPATLSGGVLNIPEYGGGGTPGGSNGEIQYRVDATTFGGVPNATWNGTDLILKNPKIGQSNGNGHFHMHTINTSPPSPGEADYITIYADKSPKQLGVRFETDGYTSALQFGATANQIYTFPDRSGNIILDTGIATFNNGTSAGEIRLLEGSGSGSNYVAVKAPATLASDYSLTLPISDGTAGNVLQTNGSGSLSWVNNGGATINQYRKNTTATTVTNPSGNTILETLLIPAGTFTSNDSFLMMHKNTSTVTTTAYNLNISINTSAAIGGVLILGPSSVSAGVASQNSIFGFNLYGGGSGNTTRYMKDPLTSSTLIGSSTTSINWSVDQYIVVWVTTSATRNITNLLISTTPT